MRTRQRTTRRAHWRSLAVGALASAAFLWAAVGAVADGHSSKRDDVYSNANGDEAALRAVSAGEISQYYHFTLPQQTVHSTANPSQTGTLLATQIDSKTRTIFLTFRFPNHDDQTVGGTVPKTPIEYDGNGNAELSLHIPLKSITTQASAGSVELKLAGRFDSSTMSLDPSGTIAAAVPGVGNVQGDVSSKRIKLKRTHGATDHPLRNATYRGHTSQKKAISLETVGGGNAVAMWKLSTPSFPCSKPSVEDSGGAISGQVGDPIPPRGPFVVYTLQKATYPNGALAGYETIIIVGRFANKNVIVGTFFLHDYVTSGIGSGAECVDDGSFHASTNQPQ